MNDVELCVSERAGKIVVVLTRPEGYRKRKDFMPYDLVYRKYPNFRLNVM